MEKNREEFLPGIKADAGLLLEMHRLKLLPNGNRVVVVGLYMRFLVIREREADLISSSKCSVIPHLSLHLSLP